MLQGLSILTIDYCDLIHNFTETWRMVSRYCNIDPGADRNIFTR